MNEKSSAKRRNPFVSAYEWAYGPRKSVHFTSVQEAYFRRPRHWVVDIFFLVLLVIVVIFMNKNLDMGSYFSNIVRWENVVDYFSRLFSINWEWFFGYGEYAFSEGVVYQCFQTFAISFLATGIGAILALPFGLLSCHSLFGKWATISEGILIIIRTIPELLLALFMVGFSGVNVLTGILALGLHSIGMIGKLYADQIEACGKEPMEALASCGGKKMQSVHLGIMPNVAPNLLSVALYRFDINVRSATIIGAVVGGDCGIGFSIMTHIGHPELLGAEILGVIVLVLLTGVISSMIRKKLV